MIYEPSAMAIAVFAAFVAATLGLSFYFGRQAKDSQGYFAAHGQIPWFVNGVAFAGDYLSAASFLGICGMIASYGYDGFLYSIGFLAGWVVALFVVAEPMKRLGKFTFADALNANFNSPGIKVAAGVSTLLVSVFYLIPQMSGAGVLVQPLLGLEHWQGVVIVGAVVIAIVTTAGMVSTTWVQFLKGGLLLVFSTVLVVMILQRGFKTDVTVDSAGSVVSLGAEEGCRFRFLQWGIAEKRTVAAFFEEELGLANARVIDDEVDNDGVPVLFRFDDPSTGGQSVWRAQTAAGFYESFWECQTKTVAADGKVLVNGLPFGVDEGETTLAPVGTIVLPDGLTKGTCKTGPLGPVGFLSVLNESEVLLWESVLVQENGGATTIYYPKLTPGAQVLRPWRAPQVCRHPLGRLDPEAGLRVVDARPVLRHRERCRTSSSATTRSRTPSAARKSTIVGIACHRIRSTC